jgi:hypothetical protein
MRKVVKDLSYTFVVFILLFTPKGLNAEDDLLRKQVNLYYQAWEKQEPKSVWELMSASMKDGWHNDISAFEAHSKKFYEGTKLLRFEIMQAKRDSEKAYVHTELLLELKTKDGFQKKSEKDHTRWVLEKNVWHFDGNATGQASLFTSVR